MVKGVQTKPKQTALLKNRTQKEFGFPSFDRRKIEASFDGRDSSSDGGVILLRQVARRLGLIQSLATLLPDSCDPA